MTSEPLSDNEAAMLALAISIIDANDALSTPDTIVAALGGSSRHASHCRIHMIPLEPTVNVAGMTLPGIPTFISESIKRLAVRELREEFQRLLPEVLRKGLRLRYLEGMEWAGRTLYRTTAIGREWVQRSS